MGGAKVSDKLSVLLSLVDRVQGLVIGGAMAYTFLKAKGVEVGASRVEDDLLDDAQAILRRAAQSKVEVHLPVDHVIVENFNDEKGITTPDEAIPEGMMALDIGPKTQLLYANVLTDAQTVFWNGPMGVFERDAFAAGTFAVAQAIALSDAKSIVGGGDSASAIQKAGLKEEITHVSTGGGASLEFVEGRKLPGVEALRAHHEFDLG